MKNTCKQVEPTSVLQRYYFHTHAHQMCYWMLDRLVQWNSIVLSCCQWNALKKNPYTKNETGFIWTLWHRTTQQIVSRWKGCRQAALSSFNSEKCVSYVKPNNSWLSGCYYEKKANDHQPKLGFCWCVFLHVPWCFHPQPSSCSAADGCWLHPPSHWCIQCDPDLGSYGSDPHPAHCCGPQTSPWSPQAEQQTEKKNQSHVLVPER